MKLWIILILASAVWSKTKKEQVQLQNILIKNTDILIPKTTTPKPSSSTTTTTAKPTDTTDTSLSSTSSTTITTPPFSSTCDFYSDSAYNCSNIADNTTCITTSAPPEPDALGCEDVVYLLFQGKNVTHYLCTGSLVFNNYNTKMIIAIQADQAGSSNFPSNSKANYFIKFSNKFISNISDTFLIKGPGNTVNTADSTSVTTLSKGYNVTSVATYMYILSESNSNTQAVVVAVLEGLILLAILVVVFYRECFSKKKRGAPSSFSNPASGTASYTANPYGTSGAGVNYGAGNGANSYYDGAAEAYRRDRTGSNEGSNGTTMRNTGYGYDQPSIRLEDRSPPATIGRTQNRVQTETPALVPVPLGGDPLNQWGDQRSRDPFS